MLTNKQSSMPASAHGLGFGKLLVFAKIASVATDSLRSDFFCFFSKVSGGVVVLNLGSGLRVRVGVESSFLVMRGGGGESGGVKKLNSA